MAEKTNQSFANHVKRVPTFHFFVLPVLTLNLVQSIYRLVHTGFRWDALVGVLTAAALLLLAFHARLFALRVQDRVIRMSATPARTLVILKYASRDRSTDFRPTKYSAPRPPRRAPALR